MPSRLTVGSLFAGIGGFDLGLERAGMEVRWQVDIEPFARHILNKHWPDIPCYSDIRDVRGEEVEPVDVLCGGFPCQDISDSGKRAGIEGTRSSLWGEYARLVGELRPRYVIVENVAALRRRGLDVVLGDLATLGYDAEWDCFRASDFGAPHPRDRLWLVAYPEGGDGGSRNLLEASAERRAPLAVGGLPGLPLAAGWQPRGVWGAAEPPTPLLVDGVPGLVDEIHSLGNALVPQIAEQIGAAIVAHERLRSVGEPDQERLSA